MKPLKIKLWRLKNVVLMQVLEQDDRMRHIDPICHCNGMRLGAADGPVIFPNSIFVRGNNNKFDDNITCVDMGTDQRAVQFIRDARELVKKANGALKYNDFEPCENDFETYILE